METSGAAAAPLVLTVYSRPHCRLCDEMMAGLHELQARFAFEVAVVDVDVEPDLTARYGQHVPVLTHGGRELCRHRIDAVRLTAYLDGFH